MSRLALSQELNRVLVEKGKLADTVMKNTAASKARKKQIRAQLEI